MVRSYPLFAAVAGSTALLAGASAAFEKHNKLQGRSSSYGWKIKDDWTGERIYQEWEYNVASVDNEGVAQCECSLCARLRRQASDTGAEADMLPVWPVRHRRVAQ